MPRSTFYFRISPPAKLRSFIKFYWVFEGDYSDLHLYQQPTTASVFPTMTFFYKGILQHSSFELEKISDTLYCFLTGPTTNPGLILTNQKVGVIGVCLYPQALETIFKIPVSEFFNDSVSLMDIGNPGVATLAKRIYDAPDNPERINLVSRFFEKQLFVESRHLNHLQAAEYIQLAIQSNGRLSIKELANRGHVSQRHFERVFKRLTGFSPMDFSRVLRFENAIGKFYNGRYSKLTDLAYDAGYYDQAHFICEFKTFSGQTPKNYFHSDLSYFFE